MGPVLALSISLGPIRLTGETMEFDRYTLVPQDPSVRAGRMAVEAMTWLTPMGALALGGALAQTTEEEEA